MTLWKGEVASQFSLRFAQILTMWECHEMIEVLAAAGCYSLLAVPHGVDLEEEVMQNLQVVLG